MVTMDSRGCSLHAKCMGFPNASYWPGIVLSLELSPKYWHVPTPLLLQILRSLVTSQFSGKIKGFIIYSKNRKNHFQKNVKTNLFCLALNFQSLCITNRMLSKQLSMYKTAWRGQEQAPLLMLTERWKERKLERASWERAQLHVRKWNTAGFQTEEKTRQQWIGHVNSE
jgi:hypothetical protein